MFVVTDHYNCFAETILIMGHNIIMFLLRNKKAGLCSAVVGHLTCKSEVLGWIPGLATYFHFSFRCFKRGSCQLLAKVCARSTG